MKKFISAIKQKNIGCGYLYFYIHFIVEIVCFYYLTVITNGSRFVWLIPLLYDGLAFVPQSMLGYLSDKFPKLRLDFIGIFLLFISVIIFGFTDLNYLYSLIPICLGNCCLHISGAEVTLRNSNGRLSHSAIFVAGGSFGVISGKLLATTNLPIYLLLILILSLIPFTMLASTYNGERKELEFNIHNKKISHYLVILGAFFVVIIRGYIGYGIPTSWNKTIIQAVILYFTMGLGKALGGILSDAFGVRKIAVISCLLSIPFLCFGDNLMIISLIGVMLFSMTMSITLGLLTSVLNNNPGLAFGITTIGLFIGTVPIFFIKITNYVFNIGLIIGCSVVCALILLAIISKEDKHD